MAVGRLFVDKYFDKAAKLTVSVDHCLEWISLNQQVFTTSETLASYTLDDFVDIVNDHTTRDAFEAVKLVK